MFRLRLRTVLIVVSLFVLVLPVAGLQVLRIYESALLRQTESELIAQAAFVSASFRAAFRKALDGDITAHSSQLNVAPTGARFPVLDFAESSVYPPFPSALPAAAPDAIAQRVGAELTPVLNDAQAVTLAGIRVVDHRGVVVATTGEDLGLTLAHGDEIRKALAGINVSRLRSRTPEIETASITSISRSTLIRVFVTSPILLDNRVIGAVMLSRTPSNILRALYGKRFLLLQAAVLIFAVVVGIALFASRMLVQPIQRLARGAERLSRGETDKFEGQGQYRTLEIAQLSDSVAAMADSLQQRAGYVRDFARHVSHEFKTPITAIRGAVEVLRDHQDDMTTDERRRFLDNVSADVGRLDRLTRRLLELAHADMAGASVETTDVLAVARNLECDVLNIADGPDAFARITRTSMEAVLENLIDNAVQQGASHIDVRAGTNGSSVEIWVDDDGPGVSPGNQSRIFEPFFTTKRDSGGTGLGLAISASLVRNAGGTIELEPSDRGASFKITLPQ